MKPDDIPITVEEFFMATFPRCRRKFLRIYAQYLMAERAARELGLSEEDLKSVGVSGWLS